MPLWWKCGKTTSLQSSEYVVTNKRLRYCYLHRYLILLVFLTCIILVICIEILPLALSYSRAEGRRKTEKRQTKALNKAHFKSTKQFAQKGQRSGEGQVFFFRSKVKNTGFHMLDIRAQLAQRWSNLSTQKTVWRLVNQFVVLKTVSKGQDQGQRQVGSPKVICRTE